MGVRLFLYRVVCREHFSIRAFTLVCSLAFSLVVMSRAVLVRVCHSVLALHHVHLNGFLNASNDSSGRSSWPAVLSVE